MYDGPFESQTQDAISILTWCGHDICHGRGRSSCGCVCDDRDRDDGYHEGPLEIVGKGLYTVDMKRERHHVVSFIK